MDFTHQYSFVDRLLHRLAFASWPIQVALADMEEVSFKARLEPINIERPVFVAGLPRAGTTLVLQMLENSGEFASYRYRDMPFLLTPMLWSQMSKGERSVEVRERAHGDGVAIGIDSPEAFEEVVWRTFHKPRYKDGKIKPWKIKADPDFEKFFRGQARKIIAIRSEEQPTALRYLSKSNGNIARLGVIHTMFPDAVLIVPYRDPVEHAKSLLRQHLNFLEMHAGDAFTRQYMEAIGHYDFGANLKPINFGDWLDDTAPDFATLDGWLAYWCAAYEHLADQARDLPVTFLSYDRLCSQGAAELQRLEAIVGLARKGALTTHASDVWAKRPAGDEPPTVSPQLLARARAIQARLDAACAASLTVARAAE